MANSAADYLKSLPNVSEDKICLVVFSVKDAIAQMGPIGTFKIKLDNAGSAGNPFIIKCFGCD